MSSSSPHQIQVGKKYRFEVASAEEAVSRIREQMGTRARVISVRQKSGKGLGRFMSSPRLEIVAMIPEDAHGSGPARRDDFLPNSNAQLSHGATSLQFSREDPREADQSSAPEDAEARAHEAFQDPGPSAHAEAGAEDDTLPPEAFQSGRTTGRESEGAEGPAPHARTVAPDGLEGVLTRAGLDSGILNQFQDSERWDAVKDLPLHYALSEFGFFLKQQFNRLPRAELAPRVAFLGLPGAGKTTALCKVLSEKVFRFGEKPGVAKLDSELPNPDDALRVFCDVLGVPFTAERPGTMETLDDEEEPGAADDAPLLLDTCGLGLRELEAWDAMDRRLTRLGISSRILVLNAAYDVELLKQQIRLGDRAGATHFILTHLDETQAGLRIWPVIFGAGLSPWILSYGQDVAGDFTSHVFEYLLGETLPSLIKKERSVDSR